MTDEKEIARIVVPTGNEEVEKAGYVCFVLPLVSFDFRLWLLASFTLNKHTHTDFDLPKY